MDAEMTITLPVSYTHLLLLKIGAEKRYIAEHVIIYTAEQLARILFSEVSMAVLQMTGNDHTEQ